ncbi:YkgJ family cysteine cluster protein [Sphingomonas sp. HF-S4]|uniref:YkgJ family cysteine cluster protein n=1 Tax=Sphingomonas agrestis TaxID=3080540 RepID=A0ABU3Y5E9_9SPHN|nr:YkgJ family cysteine cluster protein [Sphingomonas sp. HF-S4]MDV3456536.1 YkgJ family cysteine cluster protein [Sphingomonas sp. HF-S4]
MDQNAIPCDGCTECCKTDQVILRPEAGDDVASYDVEYIASALYPGRRVPALKRDPRTGFCVYLVEDGCAIHGRAPWTCRRFHCARMFKALGRLPRAKRDALWARGDVLEEAIVERGRDRLKLAETMGLDHLLDTDMQVAAFEKIVAATPRR